MKSLSALTLAITALALTSAGAATYTFNGLSAGTLAGQDNWNVNFGDSSNVIQAGTGFDTTSVMANPGPAGPTGVHRMSRTNNGNFSFGSLAGAIGLTLSFDTQVHNDVNNAQDFINFALADASDANGSPTLAYLQNGNGTPQVAYAGSGSGSGQFSLPNTGTNDWIRLSLVMNFQTPLTGGTITYQDLTTGGSVITIMSGLNIGNPTAVEALWNTMWSRSDNGINAATSEAVIDNLTITPTFVPEMNGAWIAGACALLLVGHFVRRRRVRRLVA